MFFDFIKKNKTKTLLILAGFLVIAGLAGFLIWTYQKFFGNNGVFLGDAPDQSVIFWQSREAGSVQDKWLWDFSRAVLSGEVAGRTEFLEESVEPEASEFGLAILPDFSDFIFFAEIDPNKLAELQKELDGSELHFAFDNGKIVIASSEYALEQANAVRDQKNISLAADKMRLASFNRAMWRSSAGIYFAKDFKFDDFLAMPWHSDFWSENTLTVVSKISSDQSLKLSDFSFLAISDSDFVRDNAENILKNDLAALLPESRDKKLPDGTIVKEIVANPDAFAFGDYSFDNRTVRNLSVPALGQDFFIGRARQKVLISNSQQMFSDFLADLTRRPDYYGKSLPEMVLDFLKWMSPEFGGVIFEVNSQF